jgi:CPA2 family monovalent cation:H+ antiporter-2
VITTLLTPYLIRSSDGVLGWFDRVAPRPLISWLELYSQWLERFRAERRDTQPRRLARKWALQMTLNVALSSGAFMAAAAVADRSARWWPNVPVWIGGARGVMWLAAAIVALPGLIATVRKLQAFAMLVSEASVPASAAGKNTAAVRTIISRTVFVIGVVALGAWVLLLSAALLPGGLALVLLLLIVSAMTLALWRFFIQVHAKAQVALRDTLAQPPLPPVEEHDKPLPVILREAKLETVAIPAGSAAAGKLIRELQLRTQTGASAVGIERAGTAIVNPGPDEEIQAGDKLLLIGSREQLVAARKLLSER